MASKQKWKWGFSKRFSQPLNHVLTCYCFSLYFYSAVFLIFLKYHLFGLWSTTFHDDPSSSTYFPECFHPPPASPPSRDKASIKLLCYTLGPQVVPPGAASQPSHQSGYLITSSASLIHLSGSTHAPVCNSICQSFLTSYPTSDPRPGGHEVSSFKKGVRIRIRSKWHSKLSNV